MTVVLIPAVEATGDLLEHGDGIRQRVDAHVVALDVNGSPVASTISNPDGTYEIDFLPAGAYRLYAEPIDGPYVARFRALASRLGVWLLACFAERGRPDDVGASRLDVDFPYLPMRDVIEEDGGIVSRTD